MAPEGASVWYEKILDNTVFGLDSFSEIDFHPCLGTIVVVIPDPIKESDGGVVIPESVQQKQHVARVAAVPRSNMGVVDPKCPVVPGDWIVARQGTLSFAPFPSRPDLFLVQYTDDMDTDVMGVIPQEKAEASIAARKEKLVEGRKSTQTSLKSTNTKAGGVDIIT